MKDETLNRLVASRRNFNIAARVLDTTTHPDLLTEHAADYLRARKEHEDACRAAMKEMKEAARAAA